MNQNEIDITKKVLYFVLFMFLIVIALVLIQIANYKQMQKQLKKPKHFRLEKIIEVELTEKGHKLISKYKNIKIKNKKLKMPLYELASLMGPYLHLMPENEIIRGNLIKVIK